MLIKPKTPFHFSLLLLSLMFSLLVGCSEPEQSASNTNRDNDSSSDSDGINSDGINMDAHTSDGTIPPPGSEQQFNQTARAVSQRYQDRWVKIKQLNVFMYPEECATDPHFLDMYKGIVLLSNYYFLARSFYANQNFTGYGYPIHNRYNHNEKQALIGLVKQYTPTEWTAKLDDLIGDMPIPKAHARYFLAVINELQAKDQIVQELIAGLPEKHRPTTGLHQQGLDEYDEPANWAAISEAIKDRQMTRRINADGYRDMCLDNHIALTNFEIPGIREIDDPNDEFATYLNLHPDHWTYSFWLRRRNEGTAEHTRATLLYLSEKLQ